jgi:two-component system C4-dicarboxylate transport response regulator DctD
MCASCANAADRFALDLDLDLVTTDDALPAAASNLAEQVAAHEKKPHCRCHRCPWGEPQRQRMRRWGFSRKSLYEKMQKHGLSRQDFFAGWLRFEPPMGGYPPTN